jgi:hypothetical protein
MTKPKPPLRISNQFVDTGEYVRNAGKQLISHRRGPPRSPHIPSTINRGSLWTRRGCEGLCPARAKSFAIYELLQNAYDEASTKVEVRLTEPKNGTSVLTCTDNSPKALDDKTFQPVKP